MSHPYQLVKRIMEVNNLQGLPIRYYKVGKPKPDSMRTPTRESADNPHDVFMHDRAFMGNQGSAFCAFEAIAERRQASDMGPYYNEKGIDNETLGWEYGINGRFPVRVSKWTTVEMYLLGIDFLTADADVAYKIAQKLGPLPVLYNSGRSFHAYYPQLVNKRRFEEFMYSCMNVTGIDQQWVKIKTEQSTCVLRWSARTEKYTKRPELVYDTYNVLGPSPDTDALFRLSSAEGYFDDDDDTPF